MIYFCKIFNQTFSCLFQLPRYIINHGSMSGKEIKSMLEASKVGIESKWYVGRYTNKTNSKYEFLYLSTHRKSTQREIFFLKFNFKIQNFRGNHVEVFGWLYSLYEKKSKNNKISAKSLTRSSVWFLNQLGSLDNGCTMLLFQKVRIVAIL